MGYFNLLWCMLFHGRYHVVCEFPKPRPAAFGGQAYFYTDCTKCQNGGK